MDGSVLGTGLRSVLTVFVRCFLKFNGQGVFVPETGRKIVCSLSGRLSYDFCGTRCPPAWGTLSIIFTRDKWPVLCS